MQIDSLPEIKLKPLEKIKATEYKVNIEKKLSIKNLKKYPITTNNSQKKKMMIKFKIGDQVVFDYSATVNEQKFGGSEGKGVQIELGKDLFLKGFDEQLVGVKKNDIKVVSATLPANHPKKEG